MKSNSQKNLRVELSVIYSSTSYTLLRFVDGRELKLQDLSIREAEVSYLAAGVYYYIAFEKQVRLLQIRDRDLAFDFEFLSNRTYTKRKKSRGDERGVVPLGCKK